MTVYNFDFNVTKPYMSAEESFIETMIKHGLNPPSEILQDGEIHRFGDDKSKWYIFFPDTDNPGAAAGDWRWDNEKKVQWSYRTDLSDQERYDHVKRMESVKKIQEDERKKSHDKARHEVKKIWDDAREPEDHPYLEKKGVKAYNIKIYQGNLLIPMRDENGILHSIQRISKTDKYFYPGGRVKGCYHTIQGRGKYSYLCEGYATGATIHEATGATVYVAFSAGNLKTVSDVIPDKNLIIAADNDETGRKAAEATGKKYILPIGINGTDFNDLAQEKGISEVRRQLKPSGNKFQQRVLVGEDLLKAFLETLTMGWTIEKILPESSNLIVVFGAPSGGKSFAVLDMCLSITTGKDWHGYAVKQRSVLYLAAEGQTGMLKRIKAWKTHHGIDHGDFALLPMPCIIDSDAQRFDLIQLVESLPFKPKIIVLDTLARSIQGDENSTKDMGLVVAAAGELIDTTGAQVILIHHSGKDETKGARGAIALTGATDTMLKVVKSKVPKQYFLICERQKDDEPFPAMTFNMIVVDTGYKNQDGQNICSLVPELDVNIAVTETKKKKYLNSTNKMIFQTLKDVLKEKGEPMDDEILGQCSGLITPDDKMVLIEDWEKESIKKNISNGNEESAKRAFRRSVKFLQAENYVGNHYFYAWILH